ncbi:hypothetical protein J7T55_006594 [Diaporthe amygdali]|uniref:uncharacterized protein n=1 Tax=Phomopsis amygdali TaxID=1214568 RepID=UPI0022FE01EE|nr:uncharacterized protein J7T55_006594 [Diaporthe amygdali]KAJ0125249.1 hypothetical protein J7T55_006594 [Diaporthe amygdali]
MEPRRVRSSQHKPKRIFICCDGTWVNSLGPKDEPPSNVTKLSRSLKRVCEDGTSQIIMYSPGVGTGPSKLDMLTGGAFGEGLDQDIRECYNFACANYVDGDSIILVGFSRGAFTARSVADLIASVGLLTTEGMDNFYPIFEDYEHIGDEKRSASEFLFHDLVPYHGEKGKAKILWENERKEQYKKWLKTKSWTRDTYQNNSTEIRIKAIAVWDTVGSLGIPPAPVFGIRGSAKQWKFTSTHVSRKVENAFQALSLDEPRAAFRPALWERLECNNVTNLKQVWFPGNHGDVGGGWYDQQIANISLAWICDQLSTLGIEFNPRRLTRTFIDGLRYNAAHPYPYVPPPTVLMPDFIWKSLLHHRHPPPKPWASSPAVCPPPAKNETRDTANCTGKDHHQDGSPQALWAIGPPRPWGLGQTRYPDSWLQLATGTIVRHPGCFMRADPETNLDTDEPLVNTEERIHSCVRVRLVCEGLGMDDRSVWSCPSLLQDDSGHGRPVWRPEKASAAAVERATGPQGVWWEEELERTGMGYDENWLYRFQRGDGQWQWVFQQDAEVKTGTGTKVRPPVRVLPEEPMTGYWERHLLALTRGQMDIWRWAEVNSTEWAEVKESAKSVQQE